MADEERAKTMADEERAKPMGGEPIPVSADRARESVEGGRLSLKNWDSVEQAAARGIR